MPKQTTYTAQMLPGTEPYGTVRGVEQSSIMPYYSGLPNIEPVIAAPREYQECTGVKKNGEPCGSSTVYQTNLCIGHLRSVANERTPLKDGEEFDADKLVERAFPELLGE